MGQVWNPSAVHILSMTGRSAGLKCPVMKPFFHIDLPCHENWDAMAPVKDGRFCGSCTKRVIDFTQLADAEMLEIIRNAGSNCCGRFTSAQLDRPLGAHATQQRSSGAPVVTVAIFASMQLDQPLGVHASQRLPFRMPLFTAAAFTSFLLVQALPQAHAQQQHAGSITVCQAQDTAAPANVFQTEGPYIMGKIAPYRVLAGVVLNEQWKPLRGIAIHVEGQRAPASSDESGNFYVQLPLSVTIDQPLHLRLSDNHQHVQQVTVTLRRAGDNLKLCFRGVTIH